MEFWKSLSSMLIVQFTSAAPEKTLDAVTQAKIPLTHVIQKSELTYQIEIRRRDYRKMFHILHRRGDQMEIIQKMGLYWLLEALLRRPALLIAIVFILFSSIYLPARIFFITVEGNMTIPDQVILSAAENCGIRFASSRKQVRSEQVKNALLSAVPQLQWAGINTSGCTAVISVRERMEEERPADAEGVSHLIAERDGYILSAIITSGTALVHPGETVTKGQHLISGYTDCGICIRTSRAAGEILALTSRKLTAVMPETYVLPAVDSETNYEISLIIGKKRINLWKDSRISNIGCGRMYEEYFVSLPGGFQLPIAICVDQYHYYDMQESLISESDAKIRLQEFSDDYLLRQMVAGQILQRQQRLTFADSLYKLESSYTCTEMIGKEQREQIGVING